MQQIVKLIKSCTLRRISTPFSFNGSERFLLFSKNIFERFTCSHARNKTDRNGPKKKVEFNPIFFVPSRIDSEHFFFIHLFLFYYILQFSYCTVSIIFCWKPYRTDLICFKWILHIGSEPIYWTEPLNKTEVDIRLY